MFAQPGWSIEPRDGWKFSGGGVGRKLRRFDIVLAALQRRDVALRVPTVVAPAEARLLQVGRERRKVEWRLHVDRVAVVRVVDDWRICCDQHQVVGRRWTGNGSEVFIAERVLLRVTPIVRDVRLAVLLLGGTSGPPEPGRMVVRMVGGRRISGERQIRITVRTGEPPEIVVECVVLFDDDHHMLNWTLRTRTRRR